MPSPHKKYQPFLWSSFNTLGHSSIVRSSFVWATVVPILAKMLSAINADFKMVVPGLGINVVLGVPFTWELLYYASIFFAAATLIYSIACPEVVRRYTKYADFSFEGKGSDQIVGYAYGVSADRAYRSGGFRLSEDQLLEFLRKYGGFYSELNSPTDQHYQLRKTQALGQDSSRVRISKNDDLVEAFWFVRGIADYYAPYLRYTIALLYGMGFTLVGCVLLQNFLYVVKQHFDVGHLVAASSNALAYLIF